MSRIPNDDASKLAPLAIHMTIGILTLLVIVARFITRTKLPHPGEKPWFAPYYRIGHVKERDRKLFAA